MKIRGFKLPRNKRFNYTPRYLETKDLGSPYDFDSKIKRYRETTNANDFGQQWKEARDASRTRKNRGTSRMLIYIILILTLIALYFLDFDLSIFQQGKY
ncbi:MAG: hypothetical protein HRT68_12540 [Flavobacteriaceae bacterium]|nr:hypothetical protein [Flavobacteriaceae bacterium]